MYSSISATGEAMHGEGTLLGTRVCIYILLTMEIYVWLPAMGLTLDLWVFFYIQVCHDTCSAMPTAGDTHCRWLVIYTLCRTEDAMT